MPEKIFIKHYNTTMSLPNLDIAICFNQTYAKLAELCMNSIVENSNLAYTYTIHIFTTDLSAEEKQVLSNKYHHNNIIIKNYANIATLPVYLRLHALNILKDKVERFIYLDVDILVFNDLTELYTTDLGENSLGACQDIGINAVGFSSVIKKNGMNYQDYFHSLGIKDCTKYFNAGIILFAPTKISHATIENILAETTTAKYVFLDQDILNKYFYDKVYFLSLRWNTFNLSKHRINLLKKQDSGLYQDFAEIINTNSAAIIHFVGTKPWQKRKGIFCHKFYAAVTKAEMQDVFKKPSFFSRF